MVRELRDSGVTIILTTHYIEEAQDMADRVGVITNGELILVEEKNELMRKLGKKQLALHLQKQLDAIPAALAAHDLTLADDGNELDLHLRHAGRAHRHHRACCTISARPACASTISTPRNARWRISSSVSWQESGGPQMNLQAVRAIYYFEMARTGRTLLQSIVSPVISTSLYFVVFGAAIGSRITRDRRRARTAPSSCPG